jgi:hypothetical protein
MTDWRIRAYQPGDEEGIAALFETVFRQPLSRARWRWKLHTLPAPTENEWVAEADGRIVGHYAVTPVRFQIEGREVIVPHTCDAMTHPSFRRSGIFVALSRRANTCWQTTAAPFKIGFPQWEIIGSVLAEVGWQRVVRVEWAKCVLQPLAFLARKLGVKRGLARLVTHQSRHAVPADPRIQVSTVCEADDEFEQLWRKVGPSHRIVAVRDRAWVQWRFFAVPDVEQRVLRARRDGAPAGYLAYRLYRDTDKTWAVLLDCFAAPQDHATKRALLQSAKHALRAQRVESIVALAARGSAWHGELRRAGFWSIRQGYDFSIVPYSLSSAGMSPHDWFLSGAESDII